MKKQRLDLVIFERGLAPSRERAKTTVMSGLVTVDGKVADKPGAQVSPDCEIEIRGQPCPYVSRGGLKLSKALSEFQINPAGLVCLDCGASTGGFTDCLLKGGAAKVYAADVGYGQLAWSLRSDERVVVRERTNVRYITRDEIPEEIDLAVMDLSFISLGLVFEPVGKLLRGGARVVCLIKPQFEAGREKVGKKGVVRSEEVHTEVLLRFMAQAEEAGFAPAGLTFSPLMGPQGNIEFLGHLIYGREVPEPPDAGETVRAAHEYFSRRMDVSLN